MKIDFDHLSKLDKVKIGFKLSSGRVINNILNELSVLRHTKDSLCQETPFNIFIMEKVDFELREDEFKHPKKLSDNIIRILKQEPDLDCAVRLHPEYGYFYLIFSLRYVDQENLENEK